MESLAGIKVLVVDDDHETVTALGELLASRDAEVATATSNAQAVALLPSFEPDVILSDINMPEGDGYQLMRMVRARIRAQTRPVVAIALTGNRDVRDHTRALLAGYSAQLNKPVDPVKLCAAIRRAASAD